MELSAPFVDRLDPASPATLIGVGVDGGRSSRDAVALASVIAQATAAELMLIAVREEMLVNSDNALAWQSRGVLEPEALVWRALRRVARHEHLDLLVVQPAACSSEALAGPSWTVPDEPCSSSPGHSQ